MKFLKIIKTPAPAINPTKAIHDIFLKYQKKFIFSIPIATTPAADPIIIILPPVPAVYAIKCHNWSFISTVNIPILAATSGTLSISADATPKNIGKISEKDDAFSSDPNFGRPFS